MNFGYFQIQKWTLQAVRAVKVDGRNGIVWLMALNPI